MNETSAISAAFVAAQAELKNVGFDSANPFFKSKYASLAAITAETRPILAKHGLAVRQIATIGVGDSGEREVVIVTELRHASGETLPAGTMTMPVGEGGKTEVQAAGSLLSYMRRYAWQTALGVAGEEDDDGNAAPPPKPPARPAQAHPVKPATTATHAAAGLSEATLIRTRLKLLNMLQAAPGQPNRQLVLDFLVAKGWLKGEQTPEEWPLDKIPQSKEAADRITEEIYAFEQKQKEKAEDDLPM